MINQSKPAQTDATKLNIGSGFNLIIGGVYKLLIGAAGGAFTNQSKASIGTTWNTWTTSWNDETKTWDGLSQLIDNQTKQSSSITNFNKP